MFVYLFLVDLQDAANIATIVGAIGVVAAVFSLFFARDTFHQSIIADCAKRFQQLAAQLTSPTIDALTAYLELCNEELFYFEKRYLPQAVVDEWVEGMLGYLGLWHHDEPLGLPLLLPPSLPVTTIRTYLSRYPRLHHALSVDAAAVNRIREVNRAQQADAARAQAVLEVLANLYRYQQQPFYAHLRRMRGWQLRSGRR